MCDPLSIGLAGVAVGSQVAGGVLANKAAAKQRAAITNSANAALEGQLADLQARAEQERQAAQLETQKIQDMSLVELGLAQASAADSNVSGSSVDALNTSLQRKAGLSSDVVATNLEGVLGQLNRSAQGAIAERDSRIAGAPQGVPGSAIALNALSSAIPYIRPR